MQDNIARLYPNPETSAKVMEYSIAKSTPLPDWLVKYHQWGCENTDVPVYLTSTYQAEALVFLARMMGAKRVLEIGVYVGFSSLYWSYAVGKDGKVVGLELSEEYAGIARKAFEEHDVKNVEVKVGDGVETLEALEPSEPFDVIFLDANKEAYPKYLDIILAKSKPGQTQRLLKPGGLILADNILRRAIVADDTPANPNYEGDVKRNGKEKLTAIIEKLREFNDKMVNEARLETVLLPLFDGLGMARLVD